MITGRNVHTERSALTTFSSSNKVHSCAGPAPSVNPLRVTRVLPLPAAKRGPDVLEHEH